jgi:hypothetical protein
VKLITKLKSSLSPHIRRKPVFPKMPSMIIEEAFTDNAGIVNYQFQDPFLTPCIRGLHALTIYEELRMRTRKEHLDAETDHLIEWSEKALASLSGKNGKINLVATIEAINEIKKVVVFRKERMNLLFPPDIAYKLASVVFFDDTENPYRYDQAYGQKKIERWKQSEDLNAFFLRQPLIRLMPYLEEFGENLQTSFKAVEKIHDFQSENLSGQKSSQQFTSEKDRT